MTHIIGQDDTLKKIDELTAKNEFPRFVILYGDKGCGKREVTKYLAQKLNATLVRPKDDLITVEYIRDIIEQAYKQTEPTVYLLPNLELSTSNQAKSALLKVTEEAPNDAYFVVTARDNFFIPKALKSRATTFWFNTYSPGQLKEFAQEHNIDLSPDAFAMVSTPGEVLEMGKLEEDKKELQKFVECVVDDIGEVSGANAFRLAEKISFNEDDPGYGLQIFWIMFKQVCLDKTKNMNNSKRNMYFSFIRITGDYISKLRVRGISKKALFDLWILEIRDTYFKYNK